MSQPPEQQTKEWLLDQIQASRRDLWALVDTLSDADITTRHDAQGWAVADHLVHLALWQDGIAALLQHQPRWAAMGLTKEQVQNAADDDALNALMHAQHANISGTDARQLLRSAQDALDAALAPLSTEDLNQSYATYAPDAPENATPVGAYIMGNSAGHYAQHLPWIAAIARAK
jgi:hypothetical protein